MAGVDLSKLGLKPFAPKAETATASVTESASSEGLDAPAPSMSLQEFGTEMQEVKPTPVLTGAEGFKAKLDKLDSLIIAGQGIDMLSLDTARAYVRDIFVEVQQNPEYDSLLVDRDVHNVMMFVQASTLVAGMDIKKKQVKAEVRALKKVNTQFDLSGFGDPATEVEAATDKAVIQAKSASQLAHMNVDDIEVKHR